MRLFNVFPSVSLLVSAIWCVANMSPLLAQNEINLERMQASIDPVPIQLEGFTGETLSVLTFDLYIVYPFFYH